MAYRSKAYLFGCIEYLEKEWSEKEVRNFAQRVHQKLSILIEQPAISRRHKYKLKIYITLLTKHTSLVYPIKPLKKRNHSVDFLGYKTKSE
jgi:hypothetical protein